MEPCFAHRHRVTALLALLLTSATAHAAESLKAALDRAGPGFGYDKYLVLETGVTYSGGLWIGPTFSRITAQFEGAGQDVRIVGNGAVLDLAGGELCIAYCRNRLDIDDCVVLNGDITFRGYDGGGYDGVPQGSVRYVTFYRPEDYGVRMFRAGADVLIERNIIVSAVDTGLDFLLLNGTPNEWLPTGGSVAPSIQGGIRVYHNWSYHADPAANADPLRHFVLLCDYG